MKEPLYLPEDFNMFMGGIENAMEIREAAARIAQEKYEVVEKSFIEAIEFLTDECIALRNKIGLASEEIIIAGKRYRLVEIE